jgi:hypothetical protein
MPLITYKFFVNPFGVDGDLVTVPDALQPSGAVSYDQGFGPDYAKDLEDDPDALAIPRAQFNKLLFDMTQAIRHYQSVGIPNFITTTQNLGTPFSYSKNALAQFDDGSGIKVYQSLVDANTSDPTDLTKWRVIQQDQASIILDNVTFDGAVANHDAVYWDNGSSTFKKAIADGTIKQDVIGFADTTYNRVFAFGSTILSGLTPNALYYLSSSVAGQITSVRPVSNIIKVGQALTATSFFTSVQQISVPNVVQFTANGSFIVPKDVTQILVSGCGGGSGGAGSAGVGGSDLASGGAGGGGAGEFTIKEAVAVTPGETLTVVIGAAGAKGLGGAAGQNPGTGSSNGGTTFLKRGVTNLITLLGGTFATAGAIANPANTIAPASDGGDIGGAPGTMGVYPAGSALAGNGGNGGSGPFGIGGRGPVGEGSLTLAVAGQNASGFGAGGGGGNGVATSGASLAGANGGEGTPGLLIIEY